MADEPRKPRPHRVGTPDDPRAVWQSQPLDGEPMLLDDVRKRAGALHKRVLARNRREYLAAAIVLAGFGFYTYALPRVRIGSVLVILGTLYAVWQMHRRTAPAALPEELGRIASTDFYRRELERQRDALHSIASWYLAPLLPGMIAFAAVQPWSGAILITALTAIVFWFTWRANRRAAARLDDLIAEIEQKEDPS